MLGEKKWDGSLLSSFLIGIGIVPANSKSKIWSKKMADYKRSQPFFSRTYMPARTSHLVRD
jgi:hypothetical protein